MPSHYDEVIEVKYFDETQIMDSTNRELLNSNLRDMKFYMEKRLNEFKQKFLAVQSGLEKQRLLFKELKEKEESCEPIYTLTRLWKRVEEDPHELWSALQTVVGNPRLLSVLEQKKHSYGINYKQLDQIVLKLQSGVATREFDEFKLKLQENYVSLREKTMNEIRGLQ